MMENRENEQRANGKVKTIGIKFISISISLLVCITAGRIIALLFGLLAELIKKSIPLFSVIIFFTGLILGLCTSVFIFIRLYSYFKKTLN
jgi:hypothetical protein